MKKQFWLTGFAALCAAMLASATPARAQTDSALLDALVKKGVLSDQEAEDIRASEEKDYSSTAASKINLSSSIQSITFYGDLRLRYELRDASTPSGMVTGAGTIVKGDSQTDNRWRYRLRFGVKGDLYDQFFYGLRLATNPYYDRSGNVTFGHSDDGGQFGKGYSLIAVDQVYLGWRPTSDITLIGGQMPNPLYTTNLVWDDNLNPTGATEQWDHTFDNVEVFATAGQWIYTAAGGNGINNNIGGVGVNTTFQYVEQAGFKIKFDDNTAFKAAATMYTYSGTESSAAANVDALYSTSPLVLGSSPAVSGDAVAENNSPTYFNGPFVGAAPASETNVTGINDLAVLETPMEFDFKAWNTPFRIFGDFAYNFLADQRADAARAAIDEYAATGASNLGVSATTANTPATIVSNKYFQGVLNSGKGFLDQAAYQVGIEAGQLKKKGDWDAKLYWQSTGYYAVDPNLTDADIFNAAVNMQGVVVQASYNWTDGLTSTVRYAYATQVNDDLATPSVNQDLQVGVIKNYNLLQADLMWKF